MSENEIAAFSQVWGTWLYLELCAFQIGRHFNSICIQLNTKGVSWLIIYIWNHKKSESETAWIQFLDKVRLIIQLVNLENLESLLPIPFCSPVVVPQSVSMHMIRRFFPFCSPVTVPQSVPMHDMIRRVFSFSFLCLYILHDISMYTMSTIY